MSVCKDQAGTFRREETKHQVHLVCLMGTALHCCNWQCTDVYAMQAFHLCGHCK
jgi:hypothetical protein